MERFGLFLVVIFAGICGFNSSPIEINNDDSDIDEQTTQNPNGYSNQVRFFRYPSNSFIVDNREVVKVLKMDPTFTEITEVPKFEETTSIILNTVVVEKDNSTLLTTTSEPLPQMLVVGEISKREASLPSSEFNRQKIEQEDTTLNLPEPIGEIDN